jgi:hypothetical protein
MVGAMVEDGSQVFQFLVVEWVEDSQPLVEFWGKYDSAREHARISCLGKASL